MSAQAVEWAPHPDPTDSAPYILNIFERLSGENAKPMLLKDMTGNEALVMTSRTMLASLTALNLLVGNGAAQALGSHGDANLVAVLTLHQNIAARPAIHGLAEMVSETGPR